MTKTSHVLVTAEVGWWIHELIIVFLLLFNVWNFTKWNFEKIHTHTHIYISTGFQSLGGKFLFLRAHGCPKYPNQIYHMQHNSVINYLDDLV